MRKKKRLSARFNAKTDFVFQGMPSGLRARNGLECISHNRDNLRIPRIVHVRTVNGNPRHAASVDMANHNIRFNIRGGF